MKILVFEFITGGGFNQQPLPESLANEGRLMLNALLGGFGQIPTIELVIMLDWRLSKRIKTSGLSVFTVTHEHETMAEFDCLAKNCDAVWPLAPEFDGILQSLCQKVESLEKRLLTSAAAAVAMTGNKYAAYKQLTQNKIPTVETQLYEPKMYAAGEWIVKPVDGAGCNDSYLLFDQQDFAQFAFRSNTKGQYIIQPHVIGQKTSLSCLFKQGRGWLLCVNLQNFNVVDKQYRLDSIIVNYPANLDSYRNLVSAIAKAFPDLWGYVGIDLIETKDEIKVLEINPRLTSSFAGIQEALGVNVCSCVKNLLTGDPMIQPQFSKPITITL